MKRWLLPLIPFFSLMPSPGEAAPPAAPNIVLILLDDLGYGDPACYHPGSKIATPHIDRLAREGMRFTDAHAAGPLCHPSRYGLLTGTYPFRTDVSQWPAKPLVREDQMTLASLLLANGYHTAMVGKWHLGFAEDGYDKPLPGGPVDRGFDSFFGLRASTDIPPYFYIRDRRAVAPPTLQTGPGSSRDWSPIQGAFWREGGIAPDMALPEVLPRLTDEAVKVIQARAPDGGTKPFFLYFAPTAPHTPWLPADEFTGKSAAGMYGDFVMMTDAMVGRILDALDERGMADNTMVILTSDNGPVWYAEDVARTGHDAMGGLRGLKGLSWEAGHRMPFLVRWPSKIKAGSVSDQLIGFTDVLATFAELVSARLPDEAGPDSFSFLPVLLGTQPEGQPVRESLVVGNSVRLGSWKWIEGRESASFGRPGAGVVPPREEEPGQLYDLARDPAETTNLRGRQPEVEKRLRAEWERIRQGARTRP
jgi:arylsulfatase A-like enzyme